MVAVLAAYMAGLGVGAAIAGRLIRRVRRPILVYGLLEGGIALSALGVPLLLDAANRLHVWALGGLPQLPDSDGLAQPLYYLGASFLILALPTGFMGATLPLLTRHAVRQDSELGPRTAWLYGINTIGAVLGTLAAAFLLLPALGLQATVLAGVVVNGLVFLIAVQLARASESPRQPAPSRRKQGAAATTKAPAPSATAPPAATRWRAILRAMSALPRSAAQETSALTGRTFWILPLIMASGANAFLYEVLWTRLLSHVLGGTIYAFATMLASFLAGIALGSFLAGRLAQGRTRACWTFAICQFLIGAASAAIYSRLEGHVPEAAGLAANAGLAALVMLPATLFIGATFPLAVRVLAHGPEEASSATARVYAWNTAGAIVGALLAGFFLIPWLGFEGAIRLALGVNFLLGAAALLMAFGPGLLALSGAAAAFAALGFHQPSPPLGLLGTSLVDGERGGQPLFHAVGRSTTVFLKQRDGYFYLRTNGLPEAYIEPAGAPPMRHTQKWLTALPVTARPDARSILIVGLGGGVAIEGVPPTVTEIDVLELEPEVIEANRAIAERRRYDPLADDRVVIAQNDARNALSLTSKTYDILVSQPSHPWTAGASHLYTAEFVDLAKRRLNPGGLFVQWINALFVDEALLRSMAATLLDRFAEVRLYEPGPGTLLFLAADGELNPEARIARHGRPLIESLLHYSKLGINAAEDLLVAFRADTQGLKRLAEGAPVNGDDDNRMATFSRSGSDGLGEQALFDLLSAQDPLLDPESWAHRGPIAFDLKYVANRLIIEGFARRAGALGRIVADESTALTIAGLGLRTAGRLDDSQNAFAAALGADPGNMQARYSLVRPHLGRLAQGNAPVEIVRIAQGLTGSAAAVARGWKLAMARDWPRLARLDKLLGRSEPRDFWYAEAIKLRADWRIQGSAQRQDHFAALRLLDRALLTSAATDLLVIRAAAGIRLEDPRLFLETARQVGARIGEKLDRAQRGDYALSGRELESMRTRVLGFSRQLSAPLVAPVADQAAEVEERFDKLSERLSGLAPSAP